jgi:hypothetical protein
MIGTSLSFLIRVELSSPGTQILANDNQLYNTIITAHAFIMSAPLCLYLGLGDNLLGITFYSVKSIQDGRVELYIERYTSKLNVKVINGFATFNLDIITNLLIILVKIMNLIYVEGHQTGRYLNSGIEILSLYTGCIIKPGIE